MKPLIVGVPREIKTREKRVGLTPEGCRTLTAQGIEVLVESGAGTASGFADADYKQSGAQITPDARSLYAGARLILKVKEPQLSELPMIRPEHILFCYLHLASPENARLLLGLLQSGTTAIAFETVSADGRMPLLKPMSEIAGGLAAAFGAYLVTLRGVLKEPLFYPDDFQNSLERIASSFPEVPQNLAAPSVVIWGGGVAGEKALEFWLKMKGHAALVEKNPERRSALTAKWGPQGARLFSPENLPGDVLQNADVWIGCVHQAGARAFQVVQESVLQTASKAVKKIIVDVSIDQGGNFPFAHPRTYDDPLYWDPFGNLRFSVSNMPSLCGPEASRALEKATLPYIIALAEGLEKAFDRYPELRNAVNVKDGQILLEAVRFAHAA